MDKKQLKPETDKHKTKDSGDTRKIEKSRTSVVSQVNKIVSERGDSKVESENRKVVDNKSDNRNEILKPTNQPKPDNSNQNQCDGVKTVKEVDKKVKPGIKLNEARIDKIKFIDKKQELVAFSTKNGDIQNISKDKYIVKRSDRKETIKSFVENNERKPTTTVIDKDMKISKQELVTNATRKRDPQILTTKVVSKKSDDKEIVREFSRSNERGQDVTVNVCDKNLKLVGKEELVINVLSKKCNSQNITNRNITKISTGKESMGNSQGNHESNQNFPLDVNDKAMKMTGKHELVLSRKYDSQNIKKAITNRKDITKSFVGQETKEMENKISGRIAGHINDRNIKMPNSKQELITKNNQIKYKGKETIRTFPLNNERSANNNTVNEGETTVPNDTVCNTNIERDEKNNVRDNNIIKAINRRNLNLSNDKNGESPRGNVRPQTYEAKMKSDRFPKTSPQQIKDIPGLVAEIDNKISNHTRIITQDYMEKMPLRVVSPSPLRKRPVIKTITSRNDKIKVYKAVSFVDQKKKRTPLKINIAAEFKQPKAVPERIKIIPSGGSVKEKPAKKRESFKRSRTKHRPSPKHSPGPRSPHTEVAKWAPNSINNHTKLYYEAWVDTTLAAISNSKNDKLLLEKQKLFEKAFQKALAERSYSPELVHENLTDERFMGRIKIRQR